MTGKVPVFSDVNYDNFIYPASVYKMYVAMEVLKQVDRGMHSLSEPYFVKSPNDVDKSREISFDLRLAGPHDNTQRQCQQLDNTKLSPGLPHLC